MSRGDEKRMCALRPSDSLQRSEERNMQQSGKKLRIRAVFSALYMVR